MAPHSSHCCLWAPSSRLGAGAALHAPAAHTTPYPAPQMQRGVTVPREQGGKLYKNLALMFFFVCFFLGFSFFPDLLPAGQSMLPPSSPPGILPSLAACPAHLLAPSSSRPEPPHPTPLIAPRRPKAVPPSAVTNVPSRQGPPSFTSALLHRPPPSPRWQRCARPWDPRRAH